jgi:hypothetical protein
MVRLGVSVLILALAAGCTKTIVIYGDASNDMPDSGDNTGDGNQPGSDGSNNGGPDVSWIGPDGQVLYPDATSRDATVDGGIGCLPNSYCIRSVMASTQTANTGDQVMLTVMVDNPGNVQLTFSAPPKGEVQTMRPAGRAALNPADVDLTMNVDPSSGAGVFVVSDVAPWFVETIFMAEVRAKGPHDNDPLVIGQVPVKIRGNTVLASGSTAVYAVASSGRTAAFNDPNDSDGVGRLIRQVGVHSARALLALPDGSLLVWDGGATPQQILRFDTSQQDHQLGAFDTNDTMAMPLFRDAMEAQSYYTLARLPDGRIAAADSCYTCSPKARVVLWDASGHFSNAISAILPDDIWESVAPTSDGKLAVLAVNNGTSVVRKIDPSTGADLGALVDNLPGMGYSLGALPGGALYVGGALYILQVPGPGMRQSVSGLPAMGDQYWKGIAPWEGGSVVAISDNSDVSIVSGTSYVRNIAMDLTSNSYGVAYLQ